MEGFDRRYGRRGCEGLFCLARLAVGATRQRNEHRARVLEAAPPQKRRALAREAIRIVRRDAVIGDQHAPGGRRPALRTPARRARLAALGPVNPRGRAPEYAIAFVARRSEGSVGMSEKLFTTCIPASECESNPR